MNGGGSAWYLFLLGAVLALSPLASLRRGRPAEGWPFVIVMLAFALDVGLSPFTAAITPVIPITLGVALLIGGIVTFPRAKVPPQNRRR
jgi:hypothetical protein